MGPERATNPTPEAIERTVRDALFAWGEDRTRLLQILRFIEATYGHIPDEAIQRLARALAAPIGEIRGVIRFYTFLHEQPRGRYAISISDNIVDRMQGSLEATAYLARGLGVAVGETRADGQVSLERTSCTGMSDQGPAALVNGYAIPQLERRRLDVMIDRIQKNAPLDSWPMGLFDIQDNLRRKDAMLCNNCAFGEAIEAVRHRGTEASLAELSRAGLRGLGGAGFRTAVKWQACREAPGDTRYVVCNADEGEPGTFKDRVLLEHFADLVIEGMTVCAQIVGARQGYLYVRGEYRYLLEHLEDVLARRRTTGLLGEGLHEGGWVPFDITIHVGSGAYVCGEESALIESLEGKRGIPRIRPPFPVTHGYRQAPTVVNNVETFAAAARITKLGADWFRGYGTPESPGTKLLSISGDCALPGVYEYPFGTSVERILTDCGATDTGAVQIAGPAGRLLPPRAFGRRIAFEDLPTGGSFMVFDRSRDILGIVRNFAEFFAHESCGFCTPCRVGTQLIKNDLDQIAAGRGDPTTVEELRTLAETLKAGSHCGLGKTAPNPLVDLLEAFPSAYQPAVQNRIAPGPSFDLEAALAPARRAAPRPEHTPVEE
jgi:[NiFe] hydrogenase diaphorase moiety large subunit